MRRLFLVGLVLVPALAFGQGVQPRITQQPEALLMSRSVAGLLSDATYAGVTLPARAFQITAFTTRVTGAGAGTNSTSAIVTDGTNTCTCAGVCAATGVTGWADTGNKRFACTGACTFPAGASLAFQIDVNCGTTQPSVINLEIRGYWR